MLSVNFSCGRIPRGPRHGKMGVTADLDRIARVCLNNRTFQPVAGISESASDQPICMIISTCLQLIMDLEYVRVEGVRMRERIQGHLYRGSFRLPS